MAAPDALSKPGGTAEKTFQRFLSSHNAILHGALKGRPPSRERDAGLGNLARLYAPETNAPDPNQSASAEPITSMLNAQPARPLLTRTRRRP